MGMTMEQTRPCTISESIIQSCKEIKSMREGHNGTTKGRKCLRMDRAAQKRKGSCKRDCE